jgi:hypothetical protein
MRDCQSIGRCKEAMDLLIARMRTSVPALREVIDEIERSISILSTDRITCAGRRPRWTSDLNSWPCAASGRISPFNNSLICQVFIRRGITVGWMPGICCISSFSN